MRYGNGVTNLYQYDKLNRLTNSVWKLTTTTLASFYYQVGLTGNRTNLNESVNSTSRTYAWQYDNLYRMTNENIGGIGGAGYAYDPVGNRTSRTSSISGLASQTPTYNTNDWLTTDQYDNNGNTTNSSGNSYQYDVLNHLTNFNSGTVLISYDGDGNRVKKTKSGTTTYYLIDDRNPSGYAQVLEEYQGSTLSRVYNYGLTLISQQISGASTNYFGYDGHGSTRFLTGLTGSITDTYVYDAYGNLINSTGSTPNNYLYCCQQWDVDLSLSYNRARYLNPNTGRFWTMDSYEGDNEDPLSLHKYLYGADNPVDGSDPSGHDDLASLSVSESLGAGLDSMYNGGVVIAGNALQKTLIGVQNGETANAILEGYLKDVAIGAGIGVAIGAVADIAGDLVYGGNIQGETVVIEVNTPTFGASQNFARAESTTEDLMGAAARAANTVKAQNPGVTQGAVYGTKVHSEFANDVVAMGLNSEVSYYMGEVKPYGYPGSVRLDVVKGDVERPQAIWDLKTGSAKLTDARIQQIRKHLPPGYQDIPIAEIKP
jgi:RHS repeat-associated protein